MTTDTRTPTTSRTTRRGPSFDLGRTMRLARWNAVLLTRSPLALCYATVMPLVPLLLLLFSPDDRATGANSMASVVLIALLFPVYYNTLSQVVTRRDELVLKRLRTGTVRDSELLASIALPGVAMATLAVVVAVPVALAIGQPLPTNVLLLVPTLLLGAVTLAGLAVWTAGWTRNAEASQLTSLPVMAVLLAGQIGAGLGDDVRRWTELTPGGALHDLVGIAWAGIEPGTASDGSLDLASSFAAAAEPMAWSLAWAVVAVWSAARSMRWEPRA